MLKNHLDNVKKIKNFGKSMKLQKDPFPPPDNSSLSRNAKIPIIQKPL